MTTHAYRWPKAFIGIAVVAAIVAFLVPSALSSWIVGAIAFVFVALTFLSLPTAVNQDANDRSDKEEMKTTLGVNG